MKKIALLLTVPALLAFAFTACTAAPSAENTTAQETTASPVISPEEALTENVFAGTDATEAGTENTDESIFYVG